MLYEHTTTIMRAEVVVDTQVLVMLATYYSTQQYIVQRPQNFVFTPPTICRGGIPATCCGVNGDPCFLFNLYQTESVRMYYSSIKYTHSYETYYIIDCLVQK